ncbi:uncharacterized protein LOC144452640 [Glandiceps talaboti]
MKFKIIYETIKDINGIKKGDHVRFGRNRARGMFKYYHHAIALEDGKDTCHKMLKVIHYTGNSDIITDDKTMGKVVEGSESCDLSLISIVKYERILDNDKIEKINPDPEKVIEKARKKLGETRYSPKYNNCEHFVTWCMIGLSWCQQLDASIANRFAASVAEGCRLMRIARTAAKQSSRAAAKAFTCGLTKKLNATTCTLYIKKVGKEYCKSASGRYAAALGGITSILIEGIVLSLDLYKIWGGDKDKDAYAKRVETWEVCGRAACATAGATVGAALGAFIPVPIVGMAIGGLIGSAIGSFFGCFVGGTIGRKVHTKPVTA